MILIFGFHAKNSTDRSLVLGCEPNIVLINCTSTHVQNYTSYYKFISLEFVNYQGHDLLPLSSVTLKQCETVCRQNCSCVGFYYKYSQVSWRALGSQNCFLKSKLLNGYSLAAISHQALKMSFCLNSSVQLPISSWARVFWSRLKSTRICTLIFGLFFQICFFFQILFFHDLH